MKIKVKRQIVFVSDLLPTGPTESKRPRQVLGAAQGVTAILAPRTDIKTCDRLRVA